MAAEQRFKGFLERNAYVKDHPDSEQNCAHSVANHEADRKSSSSANESTYKPPYRLADIVNLPNIVGTGVFILSCADSRADPAHIFDLKRGEASVIRNAGGRPRDAFRTFEVMSSIAPPGLIVVLHHTDCGGLFTTDAEVRSKMLARAPDAATRDWFGTFKHIGIDESVRQDVAEVRNWEFLPKVTKVAGYVYEIETGKVREVVGPDANESASNL